MEPLKNNQDQDLKAYKIEYAHIIRIQALYRGHMVRKRVGLFLYSYTKTTQIQALWRGFKVRKAFSKKIQDMKIRILKQRVDKQDELIKWLVDHVNKMKV